MKRFIFLFFVGLSVLASGCGFLKGSGPSKDTVFLVEKAVDEGKIVDAQRLFEGGRLLIVPFKAGENVAATDELDHLTLVMVKAMSQAHDDEQADHVEILSAEDAAEADLLVEGHVIEMTVPRKMKKWVMRSKTKRLAVKGKLVDLETEKTLAHFTHHIEEKGPDANFEQMAWGLGYQVGQFLFGEEGSVK